MDLSKVGILNALTLIDKNSDYSKHLPANPELIERFKKVWLLRARNGGLKEAVQLLKGAIEKT